MALSMLQDTAIKKGLTSVARHHTLMKESRNEVIEETSNNNRAVTFPGLLSSSQLFPTLMNPLALHASFTSNPALFHHSASPLFHWAQNTSSQVTSSTSIVQTPAPVVTKRRRKKDDVELAPLSPPTSGSSPQSNGSAPDVVSSGKVSDKIDPRERVFTCGICNRSFGYKHVLQNHERTHTGEKPFECPQCHKRFTRDHHLKTHMRLHTGEKPYHCTHCDRHFVQVANLRRHLRVHTGERPYACELCSSKFSDSNQLKAHMLIHKGEKPFECLQCQGRFRRRHHLMHHKCSKHDSVETHFSDSNDEMLIDDEEDVDDNISHNNNSTKTRERKSKDIRHVVRYDKIPQTPVLPISLVIPEQTEPEDLSMATRHRHNNNNSNSSAAESHSHSDEDLDELYYRHAKFRKHLNQSPDP